MRILFISLLWFAIPCFAELTDKEKKAIKSHVQLLAKALREAPSTPPDDLLRNIERNDTTEPRKMMLSSLVARMGFIMIGLDLMDESLVYTELYQSVVYQTLSRALDGGLPLIVSSFIMNVFGADPEVRLGTKPSKYHQAFLEALANEGFRPPKNADLKQWLQARLLGYPDEIFTEPLLVDSELRNLVTSLRHASQLLASDQDVAQTLNDLASQLESRMSRKTWFRSASVHQQKIGDLIDFKQKQLMAMQRAKHSDPQHPIRSKFVTHDLAGEIVLLKLLPLIRHSNPLEIFLLDQPPSSLILHVSETRRLLEPDFKRGIAGRIEFTISVQSTSFERVERSFVINSFSSDITRALQDQPYQLDDTDLMAFVERLKVAALTKDYCQDTWSHDPGSLRSESPN